VTSAAPAASSTDASTRRAGRGILSITGSKLYFIVAGYAVQLLLPRLLGSPEKFGLFSAAMSFVSILNNVLITATIQVVSKRVSEDVVHKDVTLREALKLQLIAGAAIAGTLAVASGPLADTMLDPLLAPLYRLSAVVVMSYALYAALIGALNGQQNFAAQAGFDVGYTTLRSGAMLVAAALGFGVLGTFSGFASAAVVVLLAAFMIVGAGKPSEHGRSPNWGGWLALMAPLWFYQLCLNAILQIDVTLLKRTIAELALSAGQEPTAAADLASRYVGFYRAAQNFAFIPYQLILSVAFVIFPMVSQAVSLGDEVATQRYIRGALRFSLLVLCATAAPIAGASAGVMRIVFTGEYMAGSQALALLSIGMVCFALFVIAATIMSGAGRPGLSAAVAAITAALVIAGNLVLVRRAGLGEQALLAAAGGTTLGTTFAMIVMAFAVWLRFKAFIEWPTAVRTLLAAGAGFAVAHAVPTSSKPMALVALIAGGVAYLIALVLVRELGKQDLDTVLRVVRRK
jgi:stage V sporulation protein B